MRAEQTLCAGRAQRELKAPNLSHFIPVDRCLAGQNLGVTGEELGAGRVGTSAKPSDRIKEGHAIPPASLSLPPASTDLETIDFIPALAPDEGKWCQVTRVRLEDLMWNQDRVRYLF